MSWRTFAVSFILSSEFWTLATVSCPDCAKFPPEFDDFDWSELAGHLKPFGHQKQPDGQAQEYFKVLRPETFWEEHVSKFKPLVFRQAIAESPAISRWTDEYLKKQFGDLDVLIELKKENRTYSARRTTIAKFLDHYKRKDMYIVSVLPDPMREEMQVPQCLLCGTFLDYIHETNFWMSSGGTRSVIHYDADHNVHCLIAGRKDFILMKKKHEEDLYFLEKLAASGSAFSGVNPDSIDLLQHPNIAKVPWTYATILPGDCIYLPSEYIHQVRSYGRSISATILFTVNVNGTFDRTGCDKSLDYTPISKVSVHWTYKKGDETIDMGYMNVEVLRASILKTMALHNMDVLTEDLFVDFYAKVVDVGDEDEEGPVQKDPREIFNTLIDIKKQGIVSKDDIAALPRDNLKLIARSIDPPHGPIANYSWEAEDKKNNKVHEEL